MKRSGMIPRSTPALRAGRPRVRPYGARRQPRGSLLADQGSSRSELPRRLLGGSANGIIRTQPYLESPAPITLRGHGERPSPARRTRPMPFGRRTVCQRPRGRLRRVDTGQTKTDTRTGAVAAADERVPTVTIAYHPDASKIGGRRAVPTKGPLRFGRSERSALPGAFERPLISREHAELELRGDGLMLSDAKSHNGTWLNGRKIDGPTVVASGDVVGIGDVVLLVHEAPLTFERQRGPTDHRDQRSDRRSAGAGRQGGPTRHHRPDRGRDRRGQRAGRRGAARAQRQTRPLRAGQLWRRRRRRPGQRALRPHAWRLLRCTAGAAGPDSGGGGRHAAAR